MRKVVESIVPIEFYSPFLSADLGYSERLIKIIIAVQHSHPRALLSRFSRRLGMQQENSG